MSQPLPRLSACCLAEAAGTFLLVFLGLGVVHAAVLTGAQAGLGQVAAVWGAAVTLAVMVTGGVSGAHINPAITVAMAVWGRHPWARVAPYVASQLAGAALAALTLYLAFGPLLAEKERIKGVVRGGRGSQVTAMCYGEYYPSPGPLAEGNTPYDPAKEAELDALVTPAVAFFIELVGTAVLATVVFAVTDVRNPAAPLSRLAPAFIGLTVACLVSVIAPLTQACFNPARDLGPRLVAYLAGWGAVAYPGPRGWALTVYALAPVLGAVAGGALYLYLVRPGLPPSDPPWSDPKET